jgi:hypothetical protein
LAFGILTAWAPIPIALLVTKWTLAVGVQQDWLGAKRALEEFEGLPALVFVDNHTAGLLLTSLLMITSLFLWIAALGVNRESEVRAAAYGLAGAAVAWAAALASAFIIEPSGIANVNALLPYVIAGLPGGVLFSPPPDSVYQTDWGLISYFVTHSPLAWAYVNRFGVVGESRILATVPSPEVAIKRGWLGPPRRSAWSALIWKQLRESAPIVLIAFVAALGFAVMNYSLGSLDMWIRDQQVTENFEIHLRGQSIRTAQVMLIYLGCVAGFVAGIGTTISELQPRLLQFWRSRPINVDQWFGFSIATNVAILTMAFALPAILCSRFSNWGSDGISPEAMIYSLLLSYASTLLMACVVRHAVYAGILGLSLFGGVLFLGYQLTQIPGAGAYERPLMAAVALSSAALLTFLAWLAVRNDWSLRLS